MLPGIIPLPPVRSRRPRRRATSADWLTAARSWLCTHAADQVRSAAGVGAADSLAVILACAELAGDPPVTSLTLVVEADRLFGELRDRQVHNAAAVTMLVDARWLVWRSPHALILIHPWLSYSDVARLKAS